MDDDDDMDGFECGDITVECDECGSHVYSDDLHLIPYTTDDGARLIERLCGRCAWNIAVANDEVEDS